MQSDFEVCVKPHGFWIFLMGVLYICIYARADALAPPPPLYYTCGADDSAGRGAVLVLVDYGHWLVLAGISWSLSRLHTGIDAHWAHCTPYECYIFSTRVKCIPAPCILYGVHWVAIAIHAAPTLG